jgi:1-deoxy-D-xylulose-5-phosphate synthase
MQILTNLNSLDDLKKLSLHELNTLSSEIRNEIITVMSKNGGHLASNLGSVDLILALHKVFNSPKDKLIFDTSHQSYTHKIITGRKNEFSKIRQYKGPSGFLSPDESPHDHFYAGHAGTALSLALGVAKKRDLLNLDHHVIPIISDAPFACGLTFEALNHIEDNLKNFILILNDNQMAISDGVGNIHGKIFNNQSSSGSAKTFFEQFNFNYIGLVDGHNIEELVETLLKAKNSSKPTIIHIKTVKGYGMNKAEMDPISYHGVKPFDKASGEFLKPSSNKSSFPKIFGKYLVELAEADPSIVAVTPAMSAGSCLDTFKNRFPTRFFDVGIAEGHAVTFSGGLAHGGNLKVVCSIYSTFFQRAFDNLFQDVVLQKLPVIFAIDRAGLSPSDGVTHHGIFDISFLNAMPNMIITQPRDGDLLKDLLKSSLEWNKTVAIRYPNMATEETDRERIYREMGRGEILHLGSEVAIFALGHMASVALEVKDLLLKEGIEPTIIDPIFLKPFDTELLFALSVTHNHFVTIEEHSIQGGLGSIINTITKQLPTQNIEIQNFALPDQFIEHGSYDELIDEIQLNAESIASQILEKISVKQPISSI